MSDPMKDLIDALAERLVNDYLTDETAKQWVSDGVRTNPAPLLPVDKAA